jgi:hypothetical protein
MRINQLLIPHLPREREQGGCRFPITVRESALNTESSALFTSRKSLRSS